MVVRPKPDPVFGPEADVAPATSSMPVSCDASFVGVSVTLSRPRLVAAAVSALEARFDQATGKHDSIDLDFLKEIVEESLGGARPEGRYEPFAPSRRTASPDRT